MAHHAGVDRKDLLPEGHPQLQAGAERGGDAHLQQHPLLRDVESSEHVGLLGHEVEAVDAGGTPAFVGHGSPPGVAGPSGAANPTGEPYPTAGGDGVRGRHAMDTA